MNYLEQLLFFIKTEGSCFSIKCDKCVIGDKCSKIVEERNRITGREIYLLAKETIKELL